MFFQDDNLDEFWMNIIENPSQMEDDHLLSNQPPTSRIKLEGQDTPITQSMVFADLPPEMRTSEDMLDLSLDNLFIDNPPPQSPLISPKEKETPKLVIPTDIPPKKEETSFLDPSFLFF